MWNHIDTTRQTGCSLPGTGIKILAESRADLQSAVWNRQFGICIENFLKQFSKAMIAKAVENPAVYTPNRRFQTADCRSALPGFGKYVDALEQEGWTRQQKNAAKPPSKARPGWSVAMKCFAVPFVQHSALLTT